MSFNIIIPHIKEKVNQPGEYVTYKDNIYFFTGYKDEIYPVLESIRDKKEIIVKEYTKPRESDQIKAELKAICKEDLENMLFKIWEKDKNKEFRSRIYFNFIKNTPH